MIEGFAYRDVETSAGVRIHTATGGHGPPVLLLHGWPQTHLCWRKVAPGLAKAGFSVVVPDLRGYGDSGKPETAPDHAPYSKRAMAQDMIDVMAALGHERFFLAGHDRGGRVAHRLALDHPNSLRKLVVLDIAPTATMYAHTNRAFAQAYYHWFFLIQPYDLPEHLIGADPEWFVRRAFGALNGPNAYYDAETISEYVRTAKLPGTVHAWCEDYRAAASIDLKHDAESDEAGHKIEAPLFVLWGARGVVGAQFDALATWREKARDVSGHALESGHFIPEEKPEETLAALRTFFSA